jgi:hypothetical protein
MRALAWLALLVSLACGLAFALVGVPGGWSEGPGDAFLLDVLAEAERGCRLDDLSGAYARRIYAKHRLVDDVIAGRLSLLEAAARFQDLNEQPPVYDRERSGPCTRGPTTASATAGKSWRGSPTPWGTIPTRPGRTS